MTAHRTTYEGLCINCRKPTTGLGAAMVCPTCETKLNAYDRLARPCWRCHEREVVVKGAEVCQPCWAEMAERYEDMVVGYEPWAPSPLDNLAPPPAAPRQASILRRALMVAITLALAFALNQLVAWARGANSAQTGQELDTWVAPYQEGWTPGDRVAYTCIGGQTVVADGEVTYLPTICRTPEEVQP